MAPSRSRKSAKSRRSGASARRQTASPQAPRPLDPDAPLALRLWRAAAELPALEKDGTAYRDPEAGAWGGKESAETQPAQAYRYVSYNALLTAARALFLRHGVLMLPSVAAHAREGRNRTILTVDTLFLCPDRPEEGLSVRTIGYGHDQADKGAAKSFTAAVKQALAKALCLTALDPPEAEPESGSVAYEEAGDRDRLRSAEDAVRAGLEAWARAFRTALEATDDALALARLRREHAETLGHPALPGALRDYLHDRLRERRLELEARPDAGALTRDPRKAKDALADAPATTDVEPPS